MGFYPILFYFRNLLSRLTQIFFCPKRRFFHFKVSLTLKINNDIQYLKKIAMTVRTVLDRLCRACWILKEQKLFTTEWVLKLLNNRITSLQQTPHTLLKFFTACEVYLQSILSVDVKRYYARHLGSFRLCIFHPNLFSIFSFFNLI